MFSLPAPRIYDQPLVQAVFEGNSEQLMELISQQEEVNAQVSTRERKESGKGKEEERVREAV